MLKVLKHFENIFLKSITLLCTCIFGMIRIVPHKNGTPLKYFKRIKQSKEERIHSALPKSLACLMPSLAMQAANSAVHEIFTDGTIVPLLMIR